MCLMWCHNWVYYLSWIKHKRYPYGITCLIRECEFCTKKQIWSRKDNKEHPVPFDDGKAKKYIGKWKTLVVPIFPKLDLSEMTNKINNKLHSKSCVCAYNLKNITEEHKIVILDESRDKVCILELELVDDVWEAYLPEWQYEKDADTHYKGAFIDAIEAFDYAIKTIVRYNTWRIKNVKEKDHETVGQ